MQKIKIGNEFEGNVFVTSDLHLLHKNISGPSRSQWKDGYRNFKDEYEMTDHLINQINKVVGPDDVLFNLGDFVFKDHKRIPEMRNRIICRNIHHIRGNHDQHIDKYVSSFTSLNDMIELDYHGNMFIMCHYAMRVWLGSHKGYMHLYGHSHNSLDKHPNQPWGRSMDVGVDSAYRLLGEYAPFNIKYVIDLLKKRDIKFCDHHDKNTNIK